MTWPNCWVPCVSGKLVVPGMFWGHSSPGVYTGLNIFDLGNHLQLMGHLYHNYIYIYEHYNTRGHWTIRATCRRCRRVKKKPGGYWHDEVQLGMHYQSVQSLTSRKNTSVWSKSQELSDYINHVKSCGIFTNVPILFLVNFINFAYAGVWQGSVTRRISGLLPWKAQASSMGITIGNADGFFWIWP